MRRYRCHTLRSEEEDQDKEEVVGQRQKEN